MTFAVRQSCSGFTLVEVALAILIVGVGLMTVFGLLPSSLRLCDGAVTSTRNGLFAETVISHLQANASAITNLSEWQNQFKENLVSNNVPGVGVIILSTPMAVKFPDTASSTNLRYELTVFNIAGSELLYGATLVIGGSVFGAFTTQDVFYTEFSYMGL
jgi:prepilin-type N-terminal cleavage/methylation domain-containing protein